MIGMVSQNSCEEQGRGSVEHRFSSFSLKENRAVPDMCLGPFGEKIFLDRYALKDPVGALVTGDKVLYRDPQTRQKEIGTVVDVRNGAVWVKDLAGEEPQPFRREELDKPVEGVRQALHRVATTAGGSDAKLVATFQKLLNGPKFIPAGRILESLGSGVATTGVNCFVLPCPPDSRRGIFSTLEQMAELMCKGGGVGINYSSLRPENAYVAGVNGRSSGAVSWLELFSYVTNLIIQGGSRRGAQMAMLACWHPEILKFIGLKQEMGRATGCNMSVIVSDAFMAAVDAGEDWELVFPDTTHSAYNEAWNGCLEDWVGVFGKDSVKLWQTIPARELWETIVSSAHACAEPGLWFQDRANRQRPNGSRLVSTNPCVTGETLIATVERGPVSFAQLAEEGQDVKVWSWDPESKQACVRWMRRPHKTREDVELLEVVFDSGLKLRLTPDHQLYTFRGKKVQAKNLKVGKAVRAYAVSRHKDGQLRAHNGDGVPQYAHRLVWEEAHGQIPTGMVVHHKNETPEDNRLENIELLTPEEHNRRHYEKRHANGLKGHKDFPEVLRRARERKELGVPGNHKVISIRKVENDDVYNGMVEGSHTYIICDPTYRGVSGDGIFSGIVSANCGEQGLPPFGVCNLGHIFLPAFVVRSCWETGGNEGEFNSSGLTEAVRAAVRFLDRVIDITHYPLEACHTVQMAERRIGLGTLGLGEMLIRMGIRYGSAQAKDFCDRLYEVIAHVAYDESQKMAVEFGACPAWDPNTWRHSEFAARLGEDLRYRINKTGLRHVCLLTQAPTGTVGTMLGTSTGIEPYYSWRWERKGRFGSVVERPALVEEYMSATGALPQEPLPPYFVTAGELTPLEHVEMQAAVQRWTDASISKTINCPKEWTVEQIGEVYRALYDSGCKGGTVYRDGCRSEQVLRDVSKEAPVASPPAQQEVTPQPRPPYPEVRPSMTASKNTPGGTVHVTLTFLPDTKEPLEIFCEAGRSGSEVKALMEALGRLMTLCLRVEHEDPVERLAMIIGQMRGIGGSNSIGFGEKRVLSIPDGIAIALEQAARHQNSGLKLSLPEREADVCPECQSLSLRREGGCESCPCGFSRC